MQRTRGMTLVEMVFFGALASIIAIAMVALFTRGGRIIELGQRSSASMEDLRVLMELLSRDVEELDYLDSKDSFDSDISPSDKGFSLVVYSARAEPGLQTPPAASHRRIEYKLDAPLGSSKLRSCTRVATYAPPGGAAGTGQSASRKIATMLTRLQVVPLVAVPAKPISPGTPLFSLVSATDGRAESPGSAVICFVVDVAVGEAVSDKAADETAVTQIATKLWCRNRLLRLPRGGSS